MRIVSVVIQNFRAIDLLELPFVDELGGGREVSVIAGPNGCGKTSILYAIVNALRGVMGYRTGDVPVPSRDDIRRPPTTDGSWTARPPEVRVEVELAFSEREQEVVPRLMNDLEKEPPPDLPNGRLTVGWVFPPRAGPDGRRQSWWHADVSPPVPYVRSWLMARSWAVQAWTRKQPGIRDYLPQIGGIHFFPQDRDLMRRVVGDLGEDRAQHEPQSDSGEDDHSENSRRSRPSVSSLLQFLGEYARSRSTALPSEQNWEERVKALYGLICKPKQYLGFLYRDDTPLGAPVFMDGEHEYPLSHAASGEHVILEYVAELTRFGPVNQSIVLIDEPEVHLHPLWVRRFYLALPQMGTANQFIMATHSPELRQRAASDSALVELGSLG